MSDRDVNALTSNGTYIFAGPGDGLHGVYISTNSGANWVLSAPPFFTVTSFLVNGSNMYAGTTASGVYKTTNNGSNWIQTSLNSYNIASFAGNSNTIFAGALGLYKSTNNGSNWTPSGLTSTIILSLAARNENIIAGTSNGIFLSTNNGTNWTQTLQFLSVYSLILGGNNQDFFAGTANGVWKSTNFGASWFQTVLENQNVASLAVSGNTIVAGTYAGGVYVSNDNGVNWTQRNESLGNLGVISLCIFNNYIFAGTYAGIWRRPFGELTSATSQSQFNRNSLNKPITDTGNTRDTISVGYKSSMTYSVLDVNLMIDTVFHTNDSDLEFYLIHNGTKDTVIFQAGGSGGNFIGTILNDSASTLISNGTAPFTDMYRPHKPLSQFNNGDVNGTWILEIFDRATGNTGTLQAWSLIITTLSNPIGIQLIGNEIPENFSLSQNYPNPFNPSTKIRFNLQKSSLTMLDVYDILGRQIAVLVNEDLKAGTYEINWTANRFSSGVYFYRLATDEFTDTKKMILLK
jgi:photosystem II stability/assembly factor-like uncharacterized protein